MMAKVLIIGAGGVGQVVTHKCARVPEVFSEILLASRTLEKCERIAAAIERPIETARVDADQVEEMTALIRRARPDLVLNVALPYQDLPIMDACLATGVDYLDTANYEPRDQAKFEYSWQWAYQDDFRKKGIMALLGSGFDPGVTNVFTAYIRKHQLDEIHRARHHRLQRRGPRAGLRHQFQPGDQHPRGDRRGPLLGGWRLACDRAAERPSRDSTFPRASVYGRSISCTTRSWSP